MELVMVEMGTVGEIETDEQDGEMIGEGRSTYGFFVAVSGISDGEIGGITVCWFS